MFKFSLGDFVKDKITGFKGVVVASTEYLTGCRRYSIQSKELKDGKPQEWQQFDEDQLQFVNKPKPMAVKHPGGPQPYEHLLRRR